MSIEPYPFFQGRAHKVMHARLEIGGQVILLSDGHGSEGPRFEGFALTLTVAEAAQADRAFEALSEGGRVVQPLQKTFFSERFGMTQDPFGVLWIILVARRLATMKMARSLGTMRRNSSGATKSTGFRKLKAFRRSFKRFGKLNLRFRAFLPLALA